MFYQPFKTDPRKSIDGFHHLHSPTTFPCFDDPIFANWMKPLQIYFGLFSTFTKISDHGSRQITAGLRRVIRGCQCFSRWFQGVHGFIFIRAIFLHNVGLPTCRARLQHGQLLWKTNIWRSKKYGKREIFKFLKNASDKIMFMYFDWMFVSSS